MGASVEDGERQGGGVYGCRCQREDGEGDLG